MLGDWVNRIIDIVALLTNTHWLILSEREPLHPPTGWMVGLQCGFCGFEPEAEFEQLVSDVTGWYFFHAPHPFDLKLRTRPSWSATAKGENDGELSPH